MTIDEEAALWVARLQSPDATAQDRARFAQWQSRDPAHAAAYEELSALWGHLADAPVRAPRRRRAAVAAAVAILLAVILGPEILLRLQADAVSGIGQIVHLDLPDGSRLDLDSDTAVALDFNDRSRNVHVLRGAVFAEVVADQARPFTIHAGDLSARALGTRYGASAQDVIVTEGTVEATSPGTRRILHAGDAARLRDAGLDALPADPAATAWRKGQLVFSQRPLAEVVDELRRYRHGRIVVLNGAAEGRKVSWVFSVDDTDAALDALAQGLGLRITRLPGVTLLR